MLFTNECIRDSRTEDDSVIANYTTVDIYSDIPRLAEIVKSKQCYQKFFTVYLGNDQYLFFSTQPLEGGQYNQFNKYHVIDTLYGDSEDPWAQLESDCEKQIPIEPLPKLPNFKLMDIEGNPVEENTKYQLEMYDQDMDILNFYNDRLSATACDNLVKPLVVKYSTIDGIHYLTRNNKYLYVAVEEYGMYQIGVTDQLPSKQQRIFFTVTQNNTFVALKWNRRVLLTFATLTNAYSALNFNLELTLRNCYHPLYFFLKRV